jgi:hypothetical protein
VCDATSRQDCRAHRLSDLFAPSAFRPPGKQKSLQTCRECSAYPTLRSTLTLAVLRASAFLPRDAGVACRLAGVRKWGRDELKVFRGLIGQAGVTSRGSATVDALDDNDRHSSSPPSVSLHYIGCLWPR